MSRDLESRQDLQKIRVHSIEGNANGPLESSNNASLEETSSSSSGSGIIQHEDGISNDECCRTPTSQEHRIPAVLSCPPAPRKPRIRNASCKRKLSEFEFFEIVSREEVEGFFRSSFEVPAKRRSQQIRGRVN